MRLEIVTRENLILRQKTQEVRRFREPLRKLARDMFETMYAVNGAGLAAPQVGKAIRMCVVSCEGRSVVLVNPEIVKREGEVMGTEGCLSIPGFVGHNIKRAEKITVRYQDAYGRQGRLSADGWFARVIQHEIDHLKGVLYIDLLATPEDFREVTDSGDVLPEYVEVSAVSRAS